MSDTNPINQKYESRNAALIGALDPEYGYRLYVKPGTTVVVRWGTPYVLTSEYNSEPDTTTWSWVAMLEV